MTATVFYPLTSFVEKTFVITEFELRKLRHDFTELITRALQPALWLLIFGQVFARSGLSFDYVVILVTTTVLVLAGAKLYPRLAT